MLTGYQKWHDDVIFNHCASQDRLSGRLTYPRVSDSGWYDNSREREYIAGSISICESLEDKTCGLWAYKNNAAARREPSPEQPGPYWARRESTHPVVCNPTMITRVGRRILATFDERL